MTMTNQSVRSGCDPVRFVVKVARKLPGKYSVLLCLLISHKEFLETVGKYFSIIETPSLTMAVLFLSSREEKVENPKYELIDQKRMYDKILYNSIIIWVEFIYLYHLVQNLMFLNFQSIMVSYADLLFWINRSLVKKKSFVLF